MPPMPPMPPMPAKQPMLLKQAKLLDPVARPKLPRSAQGKERHRVICNGRQA